MARFAVGILKTSPLKFTCQSSIWLKPRFVPSNAMALTAAASLPPGPPKKLSGTQPAMGSAGVPQPSSSRRVPKPGPTAFASFETTSDPCLGRDGVGAAVVERGVPDPVRERELAVQADDELERVDSAWSGAAARLDQSLAGVEDLDAGGVVGVLGRDGHAEVGEGRPEPARCSVSDERLV